MTALLYPLRSNACLEGSALGRQLRLAAPDALSVGLRRSHARTSLLGGSMVLSVISLVFATIALAINVSALLRRPRIVAEWGTIQDTHPYGFMEGLSVVVTARRRAVEVDEVGVVFMEPTWRRRFPEWLRVDDPVRLNLRGRDLNLPRRLQDGESVRAGGELDSLIDEMHELGVSDKHSYVYVLASGTVYLVGERKLLIRLRQAARRRRRHRPPTGRTA